MNRPAIIRQAETLSEAQIAAMSDVEVARLAERLPEERDKRITAYNAEGLTDSAIGERFGMTPQWAGKWRRNLGLKPNGVGGQPTHGSRNVVSTDGSVIRLPTLEPPPRAAHYLPELTAPDSESNLRVQVVELLNLARRIERLLSEGAVLQEVEPGDWKAILNDLPLLLDVQRKLQKEGKKNVAS